MGQILYMRKGAELASRYSGILARDLAVGSSVFLLESGAPVEYLVVNQGFPKNSSSYDNSCYGAWLLRKDIYSKRTFRSTGNLYDGSSVNTFLNGTFLNLFDAETKAAIRQAKIPYVSSISDNEGDVSSGVGGGLSVKVFLLSGDEVDLACDSTIGAELSYFDGADAAKRIANYDGTATEWWLRNPRESSSSQVYTVSTAGARNYTTNSNSRGVRPALILPMTAWFDEDTLVFKGVK